VTLTHDVFHMSSVSGDMKKQAYIHSIFVHLSYCIISCIIYVRKTILILILTILILIEIIFMLYFYDYEIAKEYISL